LFRDNLSFLTGRSPGPEFLAKVKDIAQSVDGVLGVHDLMAVVRPSENISYVSTLPDDVTALKGVGE